MFSFVPIAFLFRIRYNKIGKGKPLYVIRRMFEDDGEVFDDGSHIIYANCSVADTSTPLGQLMHDFRCANPDEMYYDVLAERTGRFKKTEEGESGMSSMWEQFKEELVQEAMERGMARGMEQGMARGMERGMEQGMERERISAIRRMMTELQLTVEKAMDVLAIPQSEWSRYKAML